MPPKRSRRIEQANSKPMDASKGKKPLDMVKSLSQALENIPESSQLSNHSPEQLEEQYIESIKKRKADFASALPELLQSIEKAKNKIEKIKKTKIYQQNIL